MTEGIGAIAGAAIPVVVGLFILVSFYAKIRDARERDRWLMYDAQRRAEARNGLKTDSDGGSNDSANQ